MKKDQLFEVLEPPPYGLAKLRRRLTQQRAHAARRWALAGVAASLVVGALSWLTRPTPEAREVTAAAWSTLTNARLQTEAAVPLGETALLPVQTSRADVAFFRLAAP